MALVNVRHRCMPLEAADDSTSPQTDHQITLESETETLTNSGGRITLNHRDRRYCAYLHHMSRDIIGDVKNHHRTIVKATRNISIARLLSHMAHVLIARITAGWMSVSSAKMLDMLTL